MPLVSGTLEGSNYDEELLNALERNPEVSNAEASLRAAFDAHEIPISALHALIRSKRMDASPESLSRATKRIQGELNKWMQDPIENITVQPIENNLFCWKATITGPPDTPYEGGIFKLLVLFPVTYPFSPPHIIFKTKIYHCNVCSTGNVCLDILAGNWRPILSVSKILLSLQVLLAHPNPDDPLEGAIARVYKKNRNAHDAEARRWTREYAK